MGQGWSSPPHLGGTCVRTEKGEGGNIVSRGISECHLALSYNMTESASVPNINLKLTCFH